MTGEIFYYYYEENKIELLKIILNETENIVEPVETEFIGNSMNKNEHKLAVLKIKDDIKNGLICLKGGDLKEELQSYPQAKVFSICNFFSESFFENKKIAI